mmetsp:Transcript_7979/g.23640  ORF Transcript_7979/g.23640 Transcript_7979/m.23640 type:complete len:243 (+) Transcript_7979:128-856(+)
MMVAARRRHRVSFSSATIHYFPMCLSENPSVRSGVALGMGGPEACRVVVDVDEHMPLRARPRRPCPWIHPEKRREILAAEGVDAAEIEASRKKVRAAQLERIKSLPPLYQLEKLPWFVARSVRRKLRRTFSSSSLRSFGSSDNLAALAESEADAKAAPKPGRLGSAEIQAEVADAAPSATPSPELLARRLGDLGVAEPAAPPPPVVATDAMDGSLSGFSAAAMDGSLHGLSAMDGSLYGLRR